ncbi:hypothetical protein PYW07_006804 [Mythimna separata]|uniref:Phospholipid scramblase n=1 Tax=Mythimna separata TaxID=271217 RepID=A0AAD7YZD5_MYTSE|nr:hypothetical protein PYW07_006804 [Mythimna separata]
MAAALPPYTVPALDRLFQLSILNIRQTSSGYNGSNYTVLTEEGEVLMNLNEVVPDSWLRGGAKRPFLFDGVDTMGNKLFSFSRDAGMLLVSTKVELFMSVGLVSIIRAEHHFFTPIFRINDAQDNPVMRLKSQASDFSFFQLQTNDKTAIGAVQKKFRGWKKELSSFKDDYVINFPADLAVTYKLAVIVACVFIDFGFHEGK